MSNATLYEFLKQYTEDIPASVQQGIIEEIRYTQAQRDITFVASFASVLPYADVLHFEHSVAVALQLEQLRLDFRYPAEQFRAENRAEIVSAFKRELPIVNGFLGETNSVWTWEPEHVHIELHNGGFPILKMFGFTQKFRGFVQQHFGRNVEITLNGPDMLSETDLAQEMNFGYVVFLSSICP